MAISIVSMSHAPAQAKAADASASLASQDGGASAGTNFANLLFGRLGTGASKEGAEGKDKKVAKDSLRNEEEDVSLKNSIDVLLAPIMAAAADAQLNTAASAVLASAVAASAAEDAESAPMTALDLTTKATEELPDAAASLDKEASAADPGFSLPVPPPTNATESPVNTATSSFSSAKSAKIAADPALAAKPAAHTEVVDVSVKEVNANTVLSTTVTTQTTQGAHTTTRQEVTMTVPTPLRDSGWSNDFGQKIVWMANNSKQSAQLTLNPPHMGPIEVSLNIDKGSATATFVSAHADVRETLEAALPRLREMLAGVGVSLGEANVNAQSSQQNQNAPDERRAHSRAQRDDAILADESGESNVAHTLLGTQDRGLVDLFA